MQQLAVEALSLALRLVLALYRTQMDLSEMVIYRCSHIYGLDAAAESLLTGH